MAINLNPSKGFGLFDKPTVPKLDIPKASAQNYDRYNTSVDRVNTLATDPITGLSQAGAAGRQLFLDQEQRQKDNVGRDVASSQNQSLANLALTGSDAGSRGRATTAAVNAGVKQLGQVGASTSDKIDGLTADDLRAQQNVQNQAIFNAPELEKFVPMQGQQLEISNIDNIVKGNAAQLAAQSAANAAGTPAGNILKTGASLAISGGIGKLFS